MEKQELCVSSQELFKIYISLNLDLRDYCLCYGNDENGMDKADGSLLLEK